MRRTQFWLALTALPIVIALAGWSLNLQTVRQLPQVPQQTSYEIPSMPVYAAPASSVRDVEALDRLAEGLIEEERRLWVVSLQQDGAMRRWSGERKEDAVAWIEQMASDKANELAVWNVNVQGKIAEGMEVFAIWGHVEDNGKAKQIDIYEDKMTFSRSYLSPYVNGLVSSGTGVSINLQASAHFDTETETWRVTLGTPAILIEY